MTLIIKDRVKEISTTTGTGPIIVGTSPINGFVTIASAVADGNTTPYVIEHQNDGTWEVGLGQYFNANTSLVRLQVLASSNTGNLVNFASGNKNVFVSIPAAYTALSIRDLSQFALTTSENLASIISNETGSGSLVFANNATLVSPNLGVANATSIIANNGFYSSNNYTGTYSDGIVVDYVTGSGRISVGSGDGLTIYNGGIGSNSLLSLSSTGALSLGASGKGTSGQVLTSSGSNSAPTWTTVTSGGGGTTTYNTMYFTATGTGVSTFSVNYNVGFILVFLNGVLLHPADYTATNGTSITLKTVLSDYISVITLSSTTNPFVRYTYTAPNTSPTFAASYSSANYLQVFLNGVLLQPADYVATDNVTITLNTIPFYNDVIDIISYNSAVASYTRTPVTSTIGQTTFPANFNIGFVNVYLNGVLLQEALDYSVNDGKNIILYSGAFVGDLLEIITYNSSTFNTSFASVTGTSPILSLGSNIRNISIQQATGTSSGYLSSSDWITFNNKAPISSPTFTGNVAATNFVGTTFTGNTFTGSASYAANVVGGSQLQIPYQADVSSTSFIAAPSGYFAYLAYNQNNPITSQLTWQPAVYSGSTTTVTSPFTVPVVQGYPMYQYSITGLTINTTFSVLPPGIDGQKFILRIKDNGTARALTWTTTSGGYRAVGAGVTLPSTTVIGKVMYIGCVYNATEVFWDVIAVNIQQ